MKNVLGFLGNLVTRRIEFLSDGDDYSTSPQGEEADVMNGANVVTSRRNDTNRLETHAILLDLDVPAWLIPSSTEGHSHLYIDVQARRGAYFRLLDVLAEIGAIEHGYAEASKRKGASYLRLPWVKKESTKVTINDPWAKVPKPVFDF